MVLPFCTIHVLDSGKVLVQPISDPNLNRVQLRGMPNDVDVHI